MFVTYLPHVLHSIHIMLICLFAFETGIADIEVLMYIIPLNRIL